MTRQALLKYFRDYRAACPDWTVKHEITLARSQGPIEQRIDFQPLRSGSYRPSCRIHVRGPGIGFQLLNRWLDIRHQQISPRDHKEKFPKVIKAMEREFLPPVRKPLDIVEVIQLSEEEVATGSAGNIQYCAGLALLNAHVGNLERASFWCNRIAEQLITLGREPADWELNQTRFSQLLHEAINKGQVQAYLKSVMRQEEARC